MKFVLLLFLPLYSFAQTDITGAMTVWHPLTLTVDGPRSSEDDPYNPFLHYRMDVTFVHDSATYTGPGYFAADGNAGESGATKGNKWRAHSSPDFPGDWTYTIHFRKGGNVAVSEEVGAGIPTKYGTSGRAARVQNLDGMQGSFGIAPVSITAEDPLSRGRLNFDGNQYPHWKASGERFIKSCPDAPENLLSYADFDGTFHDDGQKDELVKTWSAHERDWSAGDPPGRAAREKGLIGAVNYLAGKGMTPANDRTAEDNDWVLATEDDAYLIILKKMGEPLPGSIEVMAGNYSVRWLNPKNGKLSEITKQTNDGSGKIALSTPNGDISQDWVILN